MALSKGALPLAAKAYVTFSRARKWAVDDRAARYLADQTQKIAMYICILKNARNAVQFQAILDRTDFTATPHDTSLAIDEQGQMLNDPDIPVRSS